MAEKKDKHGDDLCSIAHCRKVSALRFCGRPLCAECYAKDGVGGFDLKVALKIKE